ncbi:MAG: hypothetical protein DRJ40_00015 [Thermoprotei archaeon]|nr:MAG: hypothetical protein DRJ40_00015 [Thermoprotei archaeon]
MRYRTIVLVLVMTLLLTTTPHTYSLVREQSTYYTIHIVIEEGNTTGTYIVLIRDLANTKYPPSWREYVLQVASKYPVVAAALPTGMYELTVLKYEAKTPTQTTSVKTLKIGSVIPVGSSYRAGNFTIHYTPGIELQVLLLNVTSDLTIRVKLIPITEYPRKRLSIQIQVNATALTHLLKELREKLKKLLGRDVEDIATSLNWTNYEIMIHLKYVGGREVTIKYIPTLWITISSIPLTAHTRVQVVKMPINLTTEIPRIPTTIVAVMRWRLSNVTTRVTTVPYITSSLVLMSLKELPTNETTVTLTLARPPTKYLWRSITPTTLGKVVERNTKVSQEKLNKSPTKTQKQIQQETTITSKGITQQHKVVSTQKSSIIQRKEYIKEKYIDDVLYMLILTTLAAVVPFAVTALYIVRTMRGGS